MATNASQREITVVSYGGGTNSTAMLVGLHERDKRPDAITFADTGGEKPNTYQHIKIVNAWCLQIGFPEITIVRGSQPQQVIDGTLYNECLRKGMLPSKAYGFSSCSIKWKIDPQQKFDREFAAANSINLSDLTRLIGFDADEPNRVTRAKEKAHLRPNRERYPLVEWNWGRDECKAAIARAGLPQPGKSACFFCPSNKKHEILALKREHPDLLASALEMERKALAGEGQAPALRAKGLGRSFSWKSLIDADNAQACLFDFNDVGIPETDCGCYDGDNDED